MQLGNDGDLLPIEHSQIAPHILFWTLQIHAQTTGNGAVADGLYASRDRITATLDMPTQIPKPLSHQKTINSGRYIYGLAHDRHKAP